MIKMMLIFFIGWESVIALSQNAFTASVQMNNRPVVCHTGQFKYMYVLQVVLAPPVCRVYTYSVTPPSSLAAYVIPEWSHRYLVMRGRPNFFGKGTHKITSDLFQ